MSYELNCETVRKHQSDHFLISGFCNKDQHADLITLFALHYELSKIQETVTEPMMGQIRYQWWWDFLQSFYDENKSPENHPLKEGLAALTSKVDRVLFEKLIEGHELFLEKTPPLDEKELLERVDILYGSLFKIISLIIKEEFDLSLARSFGLVELMRLTPFLSKQGRIIIPVSFFEAFGEIDDEGIIDLEPNSQNFIQVAQKLYELAFNAFDQTKETKGLLSLYRLLIKAYLKDIARIGFQLFDEQLQKRPNFIELKILIKSIVMRLF